MDIYSEETLMQFAEQNPLDFSQQRIELIRRDFYRQKRKTVSDEFVDSVLCNTLWSSAYKIDW